MIKLNKIIFFKSPFFSLAVFLSLVTSVLFGTRLASEWGSDFGVYFVGGMSIDKNFGLYGGFFDHKGPTYYAFIRLLGFFVPFSTFGAVLTLSLTCLVWFLTIFISAKILNLSHKHILFLIVIACSVFVGQSSNSSIALFLSSLQVLYLVCLMQFRISKNLIWISFASLLISFAILTRLDSFLLLPIFVYFIGFKKVKLILMFLTAALLEIITLLYFFSLFLNFSFEEFWYQAVVFNLTDYPSALGTFGLDSHLLSFVALYKILFQSGLLFVTLYVVVYSHFKFKLREILDLDFLLIYGLFVFFVIGSGKDYHRFIFFTFLVFSFFTLKLRVSQFKYLPFLVGLVFILNIPNLTTMYVQSKCLFSNCASPYDELAAKTGDYLFFINQGWPFLISGNQPEISFTSFFPLASNIKTASDKVILDASSNPTKTIVLSKSDYAYLSQTRGSLLVEFLLGRSDPKESVPGYLFFAPK